MLVHSKETLFVFTVLNGLLDGQTQMMKLHNFITSNNYLNFYTSISPSRWPSPYHDTILRIFLGPRFPVYEPNGAETQTSYGVDSVASIRNSELAKKRRLSQIPRLSHREPPQTLVRFDTFFGELRRREGGKQTKKHPFSEYAWREERCRTLNSWWSTKLFSKDLKSTKAKWSKDVLTSHVPFVFELDERVAPRLPGHFVLDHFYLELVEERCE
jgi:hypothetical protein